MGYAKINNVIFNCYSYLVPDDVVTVNLIGTTADEIEAALHAGSGTFDLNGDYIVYGYSEPVSIKKTYDEIEKFEVIAKKPNLETLTIRNADDISVINEAIAELAELIPDSEDTV